MREIEVEGLFNVRVIGDDRPWLLRTGAPEGIRPAGVDTLRALGVSVIIDLREKTERGLVTHGIPVRGVSIYGTTPPDIGRLEDIYEALLRERGDALARAVAEIADAEGIAVVHCTAGKDRTGLVVALARLAAGEIEADVIADYERSGDQVRPVRAGHAQGIAAAAAVEERGEILRLHLESPAEAMQHAVHVIDAFGGAARYLRAHGLSEGRLELLREKHARSSATLVEALT